MSDDFGEIRPKTVPLAHSTSAQKSAAAVARNTAQRLGLALFIGLAVLAVAVVFFVVPQWIQPPAPVSDLTAGDTRVQAPAQTPRSPEGRDTQLPPYQTLLRQQAREKAQDELARFVELQLQLEQQMHVGEWGSETYDTAKSLATQGDEHFLQEQFDRAIASYQAASNALQELIDTGEGLFDNAMTAGLRALNARDEKIAVVEFDKAITIDPNNADAQRGKQRAGLLPQVNTLMRRAKNHQLAGEFKDAVRVYEQVNGLDPQTFGLAAAVAETQRGHTAERVKQYLSAGFSALNRGSLPAARSAFNKALQLDPGNAVALGGLEQVEDKTTNSRIDEFKRKAIAAEQAEDWQAASDHYAAVLTVDGNIQFARDGRTRAAAQQTAVTALTNIAAAPENLSSTELFNQAQQLIARAQALEPRGPNLAVILREVTDLVEIYRNPVAVTIVSDNLTQITLSTVGRLGSFERKQVNLRPGAYTLIGSRDGCRDVRQNIVVRPNMAPVDVRCLELL
jgi:tetratricopeptide (TPR) repeat protein